jgi:hypothetical protein
MFAAGHQGALRSEVEQLRAEIEKMRVEMRHEREKNKADLRYGERLLKRLPARTRCCP